MAERPSRVEAMKRYLDQHAAEIEALPSGTVQFDFHDALKARITRVDKLDAAARGPRLSA